MNKKTAVIWETTEQTELYVVDGNFTHLEGVIVNCPQNAEDEAKEEECSCFLESAEKCTTEDFKNAILEGAHVVRCGFFF